MVALCERVEIFPCKMCTWNLDESHFSTLVPNVLISLAINEIKKNKKKKRSYTVK